MALDGVVFDLDGTLVDTNGYHAKAWKQTFEAFGYSLGLDRIIREIGKGGDMLVPMLVGEEAEAREGEAMREEHGSRYRKLVEEHGAPMFPAVRALFDEIHSRGLRIAIATASKKENLEKVMEHADVDVTTLADFVVTDTDVNRSKPHPDVVTAAVDKLGLSPAQCMFVGDTPYDARASLGAGVVCICLLTGVWEREELKEAGARAVYQDTGDLLGHLDEALHLASPGKIHLTYELLDQLMLEALEEARGAASEGEMPVGSLLVNGEGAIISRGRTAVRRSGSPLAQAEMEAFKTLDHRSQPKANDLILVTTLEPSMMAFGAALESGVDTIVFGLEKEQGGKERPEYPVRDTAAVMPRMIGGVQRDACRDLMLQWKRSDTSSWK